MLVGSKYRKYRQGRFAAGFLAFGLLVGNISLAATAEMQQLQETGHHGHHMALSARGSVMNNNPNELPQDCAEIAGDIKFTVRAGTAYATEDPGTVFGMSQNEYLVEPCSRVTVTFINEDEVRHQWMIHGLPKYVYPQGMFHIEAAGGQRLTGTFIVPSDAKTYLVHCDVSQHMEKGMKGQLKVAGGNGDLWAIPGISADFRPDDYLPPRTWLLVSAAAILGALIAAAGMTIR